MSKPIVGLLFHLFENVVSICDIYFLMDPLETTRNIILLRILYNLQRLTENINQVNELMATSNTNGEIIQNIERFWTLYSDKIQYVLEDDSLVNK